MSNILPYQHKKHVQRLRVLRIIATTVWAATFLVVTAIILLIPTMVMVKSHYTIAGDQIAQLERTGTMTNPVDIAALSTRVDTLVRKLNAPAAPDPTVYISTVRSVPATGITLSGFSMEDSTKASLEVAGVATTREALQRFVSTLEHTDGVAAVESPVSNYVKSTGSPFQITVTFTTP